MDFTTKPLTLKRIVMSLVDRSDGIGLYKRWRPLYRLSMATVVGLCDLLSRILLECSGLCVEFVFPCDGLAEPHRWLQLATWVCRRQ